MKRIVVAMCCLYVHLAVNAQTGMMSTNPLAEQIMLGNYNPGNYAASVVIDNPATISTELNSRISPDSMRSYLVELQAYKNRNTGSDTVSATKGIGAARRWAFNKFQQFSSQNGNRPITK